jgi:hypothetical protein
MPTRAHGIARGLSTVYRQNRFLLRATPRGARRIGLSEIRNGYERTDAGHMRGGDNAGADEQGARSYGT